MANEKHDPEWYLSDPRMRKWMARCGSCGTPGFRADAPSEFFGSKQYAEAFDAPRLDTTGTCPVCRGVQDDPQIVDIEGVQSRVAELYDGRTPRDVVDDLIAERRKEAKQE